MLATRRHDDPCISITVVYSDPGPFGKWPVMRRVTKRPAVGREWSCGELKLLAPADPSGSRLITTCYPNSWVVKIRNTSEGVNSFQYTLCHHPNSTLRALVSSIASGSIVALILPHLCFLYILDTYGHFVAPPPPPLLPL